MAAQSIQRAVSWMGAEKSANFKLLKNLMLPLKTERPRFDLIGAVPHTEQSLRFLFSNLFSSSQYTHTHFFKRKFSSLLRDSHADFDLEPSFWKVQIVFEVSHRASCAETHLLALKSVPNCSQVLLFTHTHTHSPGWSLTVLSLYLPSRMRTLLSQIASLIIFIPTSGQIVGLRETFNHTGRLTRLTRVSKQKAGCDEK